MKISYNWLKQFIQFEQDPNTISTLLTNLGLEVEGISSFQSIPGGLRGVVVGKVLSCVAHPNADRLKLTQVDIGQEKPLQIVCGAPNVEKGQKVPVAIVGTTLYDDQGKPWKIKKSKIRGEHSYGMICAEDELGLGKSHDGIMVLKKNVKPGTPIDEIFEVEDDHIFEIGLTPNRADAMSHWGVARDLKAGLIQEEKNVELITPSVSSFQVNNHTLSIPVNIEDATLAPRYCGITISDITVKESPAWLKNRLKAIGIAPKNNVVDVTNYVMHELGQPLHAFDAAKILGNEIHVKTLPKGTKFTTLDGVERELHEEDLMICDAQKPIALAGIYGGQDSGVTNSTTNIFIESAYFNPVTVRKSAKRHGLNTDASFRYERGIDPNITTYAMKRAVLLIWELAGGNTTSELNDYYYHKIEDFPVFLTFNKVNSLIGQNLSQETVKSILASLDIKVNNVTEAGMGLTIPSYRVDVKREVDVIEEILRVYGYNNIEIEKKMQLSVSNSSKYEDYKIQNHLANQLIAQGFYETMANSLTSPNNENLSESVKKEQYVEILNPLSGDLSVLRQTLLFSILEGTVFNLNRKQTNLKFFEFGKTYHNTRDERLEKKHLALLVSGNQNNAYWKTPEQATDFFYLKGILKSILDRLGIRDFTWEPVKNNIFTEGLAITHNDAILAEFGSLKKGILKHFGIGQEIFYADFNWDLVLELIKAKKKEFKEIPKYPAVQRDFALLLDASVQYKEVYNLARNTEKKLLKKINLFDVYEGKKLPEGKKSYALRFVIQDENKTLTDKQVDKIMGKLQRNFENQLGAQLR